MSGAFSFGLVEGFYGPAWTWAEREDMSAFLATSGLTRYVYAPKSDLHLRRRWREPYPIDAARSLRSFAGRLAELGLELGVGLSPHALESEPERDARARLIAKVDELLELGVEHVALLFDDMRGDVPDLARRQIEVAMAVRETWPALSLSFCPTYYSFDPVLDRLFGPRPPDYLKALGAELDPSIDILWTGAKICSPSYELAHLAEVGRLLQRKPLLWDNYPVNDTEAMSQFLHVGPFTGRPPEARDHLAGHWINPMLQPTLSKVPILTLVESYARGADYHPEAAFEAAADGALGPDLAALLRRDRALFERAGLASLADGDRARLRGEYRALEHPGAREIEAWLDGRYAVTRATVESQL